MAQAADGRHGVEALDPRRQRVVGREAGEAHGRTLDIGLLIICLFVCLFVCVCVFAFILSCKQYSMRYII